jgi:hypothetical protein
LVSVVIAVLLSGCQKPAREVEPPAQQPIAQAPAPSVTAIPSVIVTPAPAPTTVASAAPAKPKKGDADLQVKRLVVAEGVHDHEPVAAKTSFTKDQKIFAFVELDNRDKRASEIAIEFVPPSGAAHAPIPLEVGESARWRTWAFTRNAHATGTWTAIVRNRRGEVLAKTPFEVTG